MGGREADAEIELRTERARHAGGHRGSEQERERERKAEREIHNLDVFYMFRTAGRLKLLRARARKRKNDIRNSVCILHASYRVLP